jgi:hypothetical protein
MRRALALLVGTALACALFPMVGCSKKAPQSEKNPGSPDMAAKAKALEGAGMGKKWTQDPSVAKGAAK